MTSSPARDFRVAYDAELVEEAVLRAEPTFTPADRLGFRHERDRLYEVRDPEERDARFAELHGRWFTLAGLDRPLHRALGERPELLSRASGCRVERARARRDETADLVGAAPPLILVRLCPESLLDPAPTLRLLRHELGHVADMLDPAFGYERDLPPSADGPSHEQLLRDRYRAVWCATVEGRLARRGLLEGDEAGVGLEEFTRTFSWLGPRSGTAFQRWFDDPSPTHAAIAAFASGPADAGGATSSA